MKKLRKKERTLGTIDCEGATLAYKVTGTGLPLLCIAGGGGEGDSFLPLADALATDFKTITYDRRINGFSTGNLREEFSLSQQARDAVAVLNAVKVDSAFIFGNSSEAVIAMELATQFPEYVKKAIFHEPPLVNFAKNSEKWSTFFQGCVLISQQKSPDKAAMKFGLGVTGKFTLMPLLADGYLKRYLRHEKQLPYLTKITEPLADQVFIEHELLAVTHYELNIGKLSPISQRLVFAAGDWTVKHKLWLAEPAKACADLLSTKFVTLPGGHISFMNQETAWAVALKNELLNKGDE